MGGCHHPLKNIVKSWLATVAQVADFETIIDVRSPAEFAEDHIPGAINCPVLDDEERVRVGTLYKQVSPFAARKVGAVLVARNIARHVETLFSEQDKHWRPLVYCWRGGQRSGAFTHILREIGWSAHRLEGGYKAWRGEVIAQLAARTAQLPFYCISGPTGSGKSRLLETLAAQGAQVLHLEHLARHKGSVLGELPDAEQPSQKAFETSIYSLLKGFSADQPVFVEAESRRIGRLNLPEGLYAALRRAPSLRIQAPLQARIDFLLQDYAYVLGNPELAIQLDRLKHLHSRETLTRWQGMRSAEQFQELVAALLTQHYDLHYTRSQANLTGQVFPYSVAALTPDALAQLAERILADFAIPYAI